MIPFEKVNWSSVEVLEDANLRLEMILNPELKKYQIPSA